MKASDRTLDDPELTAPLGAVHHLNEAQLGRLEQVFRRWFDQAPNAYLRRVRGRYWITFMVLRFTGAKIGEILRINDAENIDYKNIEIQVPLSGSSNRRMLYRRVPVQAEVVNEIARYLAEFPRMRGSVFGLEQGNFRRKFYRRATEARIPQELAHPHILRHTRAMELVQAGVPLPVIQKLLGHSVIEHTARYLGLRATEESIRAILMERGLL